MFKRRGGWWLLWMTVMVMWTIVVVVCGWMNLPRAHQVPHNPRILSGLSGNAVAILFGTGAKAAPANSGLIWTDTPIMVRMSNGARLAFPAGTTGDRVAVVRGEYAQLLDGEAGSRRGLYLLGLAAVWLLPSVMLLIAVLAADLLYRNYKIRLARATLVPATPVILKTPPAPQVNCKRYGDVLDNEQTKPRARATMAVMVKRLLFARQGNSDLHAAVERRQSGNFLDSQSTFRIRA